MKASGVIVGYGGGVGKRGTEPPPLVRFETHDGRSVTFKSLYQPHYSGFSLGQTVPVLYDRKVPQQAEIDSPARLWGE
ncbi:DUF3592 domain-containing protein [Geobacter sp. FeAm09]|uniref:DUF3592 domain-containing protein n=1 Tax=Geobacter sp. FeAm09 TaxID=2597769 RepID=UPI0011ED9210|nr:DUF3592 domain-containing protein [Geobacter sp. FeAm09]QEM67557.1 DUF3592 domain-containing protein [Geobacter sp. FeAm09]